ncbi:UNVERIFIED_CONTAM: hypothetical protein Slati_0548500 [Sesamum latifolium]|uniref:Uncharacterized protein n=1 Tax=Sesamum latifolium TaxID=2727402 RepID=A0AAW2XZF5_9LAMI
MNCCPLCEGEPPRRGSLRGYFTEGGLPVRGSFEWSEEEYAQNGGVFPSFDRRGKRGGWRERRGSFFSGEEGRVVTDLVAVPSSSMMDWGSSTLKASHITQLRREFSILNSMVVYAPGPDSRSTFPLANCLSFFVAQLQ